MGKYCYLSLPDRIMDFQMNFKEVLIFVAGTTPQIITETIYALSQKHTAVSPDAIFIITTSTGRRKIEDTLLKQGAEGTHHGV